MKFIGIPKYVLVQFLIFATVTALTDDIGGEATKISSPGRVRGVPSKERRRLLRSEKRGFKSKQTPDKKNELARLSERWEQAGDEHDKRIHDPSPSSVETRRFFVKYNQDMKSDGHEEILEKVVRRFDDQNLVVIEADEQLYDRIKSNPFVESIEEDSLVQGLGLKSSSSGADVSRHLQEIVPWGLQMIEADLVPPGEEDILICVIDTGYALSHPDLPKNVTGNDLYRRDGSVLRWYEDLHGHGTHVAGTLVALDNNDIGVRGANTGRIKLHVARALDNNNQGFQSDVLVALHNCDLAGARIVSLSLGGTSPMSEPTIEVYRSKFHDSGMLIVAAAGNKGRTEFLFPASHPDVISVSAVGRDRRYWLYSNFNCQVELAAPGDRILSTSVSETAVHTSSLSYPAKAIDGAYSYDRAGVLTDCGDGSRVCSGARFGICLVERKSPGSITNIVANCRRGRGFGIILFDGENLVRDGDETDSVWGILAVYVSREVGLNLKDVAGRREEVSLGFRDENEPEYDYSYFSGTSMATPHVAAAAALVWSNFPECTNAQIRYALAATAQDAGKDGCDWDYGFGIVSAKKAYDFISDFGCEHRDWDSMGGCSTTCDNRDDINCERFFRYCSEYAF